MASHAKKTTAKDRLLRAGMALCTEGGFQAMRLEKVLQQSGVPKGSFYHYFSSKKAFGLAVIDAYSDYFYTKLQRSLEDETASPLQRLKNFAQDAENGMQRHNYLRGCLVGNLGQEMAALDEDFRQRLEAVLKRWEALTQQCLQAAQQAGEIHAKLDTAQFAQFFWIGWEGAILHAKLRKSPLPMRLFMDSFIASMRPSLALYHNA